METITIESEAYQKIVSQIEEIANYIHSKKRTANEQDRWLGNDEVCVILGVSPRKMQRLRSNGVISYSIIGKSVYYRASELHKMLEKQIIHANPGDYMKLVNHSLESCKNGKKG